MKTVKLFTLGCKVNQYETQGIRERFLSKGFKELNNGRSADYCVVNTCTVTGLADRKSRNIIRRCIRENPGARILVTGCLVERDREELLKIEGISCIIPKHFFPDSISSFCGHARAFLKIQDGCNNFCSYCKVPLVRGPSVSKDPAVIIEEAKKLVEEGFKEIVLTGICLGAYGRDLKIKTGLLRVISELEKIKGLCRLRLSSIEAKDVSDALIRKIAGSAKLCKHLHIPLQSGDSRILKQMNRRYSGDFYLNLIKKIKKRIPLIAITTDVMVGFPGETEANFKNTLDLVKSINPLKVHIFPYSRREGTAASKSGCAVLDTKILKDRVERLASFSDKCASQYKAQFLGKKLAVLIERRVKNQRNMWEGYSDNYIKFQVKSKRDLKNKIIYLKMLQVVKDAAEVSF